MNKKVIYSSVVASLLLATNLYSYELASVTVSSSLIQTDEKDSTYSTEIYTKEDIQSTKSADLYDFLNSQTSLNIAPSFGNTFSQKIDLRGYGIGDGYQNVVITVDGRKLNNIDMQTQLLSAISLESIEKIEILKGSGSVQYGDGANAGAINITTNGKNQNFIKTYFGNNGTRNSTLSLGYNYNNLILNAYIDYTSTDGSRVLNTGEKSDNYNRNKNFNVKYFPTSKLELRAGRSYSNMNIKYGGSLTQAQYNQNPNFASSFTEQYFRSYVTTTGLTYDINNNYSFDFNLSDEDKLSSYSTGFSSDYDYRSIRTKFNIKKDDYNAVIGLDSFNGDRIGSTNTTSKNNKALFTSLEYYLNDKTTISAGVRKERVEYEYQPNAGAGLKDKISLNAYDIGVNYEINDTSSIFANFNKSFQAPDIDRFFSNGTFNGFIKPAKVDNYNIGYMNIQDSNKLKITIFRTNLKNEIYYYSTGNWLTSYNTNIDKSHKYGIELYDKYLFNKNLYTSLNYSYIISKIDNENDGAGAYNGKDLPGVSKHNVTLNLGYKYKKFETVLSHTYRSSAYAANDFANNFAQKQEAYNSTDVNLSYAYKNIEFFAKVQNLFDKTNGLWVRDDAIYPVNFERTYYAGVKVKF